MSEVWVNADGLHIPFGTKQAEDAKVGSPAQAGAFKTMIVDLEVGKLPLVADGETRINLMPAGAMPAGHLLRSATLIVTEAFTSGGAATLTIGTAEQDGTTIDADGIDAAIALGAIGAIGDEVACDGALIASILAAESYLTATVGTADFTAGKARLIIEMLPPEA